MRWEHRTATLVVVVLAAGCSATASHPAGPAGTTILFSEGFDVASRIASDWRSDVPPARLGVVRMGDGETGHGLGVVLPAPESSADVTVRRWIAADDARGHRVRLSARVRSVAGAAGRIALAVERAGQPRSYDDRAESRAHSRDGWSSLHAVVDVAPDATGLELAVIARGTGEVWIDDVVVERLPADAGGSTDARALGAAELERVVTLTRAIGLIRYFHPSDQSAQLDWDAFVVAAVERVLAAGGPDAFLASLEEIFADVAPTADFYRDGAAPSPRTGAVAAGVALTRWHHVGLGGGDPYLSLRTGLGVEPRTELVAYRRLPGHLVERCKTIRARVVAAEDTGGAPEAWLELRVLRAGSGIDTAKQPLAGTRGAETVVEHVLPGDARRLDVGLGISGHGSIETGDVVVTCDGEPVALEAGADDWVAEGLGRSLYALRASDCEGSRCLALARPTTTSFDEERDVVDVAIGAGLRLRLPLAVWTDGQRTLPAVTGEPAKPVAAIRDRATRLGAVATAWVTLDHFYPYFDDLGIDWTEMLPAALQEAATAASSAELHGVLGRLVAALEDDHARVTHAAAPIDGILPISVRQLDGVVVVTGGLVGYRDLVPVGSEILEIDGVPAAEAFRRRAATISAATAGWRDFATAYYLTLGPVGELVGLRIRRDGVVEDVVLPRLARQAFGAGVTEPRPSNGTELAPGVVYANLEGLDARQWASLVPTMEQAKVVIFDLRGYLTNTAFDVLSHFVDRELRSPRLDTPLVGPDGPAQHGYQREVWTIQPSTPRLTARPVFLVDGRSASAVETLLQIVRDHSIATIIGEPTGGTNGNANTFVVPGGFTVRFTGMRVLLADDTTIHGRGITPDLIVRRTLTGIQAGRDEILEAAVAEVTAR